ncbi:MAG: hypothetical protein QNI93_06185 [Kiloniellales bacterium]|nr:hypothetical protein [Kiloniellales bacterium]MDJ0980446.1 hypothetical protein [Kiloniellales bacterium]
MTKLDTFESVFKAADKPVFAYRAITLGQILLVTDLDEAAAEALLGRVRDFLGAVDGPETRWSAVPGSAFGDVHQLLELVEARRPDLVVTYRHLHSEAWRWPFSLGEHLDVLTQATATPVLVLPHPDAERGLPHSIRNTDRVMAITDHLAGENRLVNAALAVTRAGGTCWLTHVECTQHFERYMAVISRIPALETEVARETIAAQLLKEPHDFIRSCRAAIEAEGLDVRIEEIVTMGDRLAEYEKLIRAHEVDLLVLHTKDEDQLAMHGLAYPLAVELRQIPLLML